MQQSKLPSEVQDNIRFLESKNVWHILSKNPKVIGCGDAASKRNRLGHIGIPIFDELKSELGYFIDKDNKEQKILVHCRGNQKLDRLKISGILNAEYQRIANLEESKGLFNPFGKQFRDLLQIFDLSTTKDFYPPYTMMTNAGDFRYAFEFNVKSLLGALKNVRTEDVIRIDNYNNYTRHKIGILTGNGPDSGILLWQSINECIKNQLTKRLERSFFGDLCYPEIVISSVPDIGISMELDKRLEETENTVIKSTIDLCKNGITMMCIACSTTQYFKKQIEDICNLYNVKFVSVKQVIDDYLQEKQIKNFELWGISHTVDFEMLSAFRELKDKYTVSIPTADVVAKINEIAAKKDIGKSQNSLRDLINNIKPNTFIIALTELSTTLSRHKKLLKGKTLIDSLQLLANSIAEEYVKGIFDTLYVDKDKDATMIELLNATGKEIAKQELWNILCEIDTEFIPPLSYRDSTTFIFGAKTIQANTPDLYFDYLLKQEIIVCKKKENNQVVGFMSFIPNYHLIIGEQRYVCQYISTVGITKGERGNGITNRFYRMMDEISNRQGFKNLVVTRTWSTNMTHIKILLNIGYQQLHVIRNDRGTGIDTVYFSNGECNPVNSDEAIEAEE